MLKIVNPATEQVLVELEEDSLQTVGAKVRAARTAQRGWARVPLAERLECIRRFGAALADEKERLAAIVTSEMGKPIVQSRNELAAMSGRISFFLEHTENAVADEVVLVQGGPAAGSSGAAAPPALEERIRHEPLGVVANISAWNYPYFVGSNVFVPALLTGNAVLYKPSEHAMLTGLAIAGLLHDAGVPVEVFTPIIGGPEAGAALIDADIDAVFFTGSYRTGRRIAERAGPRLLKVQLELGGKDPVYVMDDVDPGAAAAALVEGAFYNAGQSCCAVERIYVHRDIASAFLDAYLAATRALRVGDPTDSATEVGPLAREPQLAVLRAQVEDALDLGATLESGGDRLPPPGYFFAPTVLTSVDHRMLVMREESFGPIIGIQVVADDAEAVRLMNDTEYGLTAGVYGADRDRAERILAQIDAGTAYWNCCDRVSPNLPWTGRKHSGLGVTLSLAGIRAFVQPKAWHLRGAG